MCVCVSQVIHLWFEDFSLEDSELCTADFITLRDDLGIMGETAPNERGQGVVS